MPVTAVVFLVGAFAMIGIPPTCGFFTKWYLISGAIQASHWEFAGALIFSSLINAIIFFRLIEIGYFPSFDKGQEENHHHGHSEAVKVDEVPISMLIPMVISAASLIVIGLYTNEIITGIVSHTMPAGLM